MWDDYTKITLYRGISPNTILQTENLLKDLIPFICEKISLSPPQVFELLQSFFHENAPKFQVIVKLLTKTTEIESEYNKVKNHHD